MRSLSLGAFLLRSGVLTLLRRFGRSSAGVLVDHVDVRWGIAHLELDAAVLRTALGGVIAGNWPGFTVALGRQGRRVDALANQVGLYRIRAPL